MNAPAPPRPPVRVSTGNPISAIFSSFGRDIAELFRNPLAFLGGLGGMLHRQADQRALGAPALPLDYELKRPGFAVTDRQQERPGTGAQQEARQEFLESRRFARAPIGHIDQLSRILFQVVEKAVGQPLV